MGKRGSERVPPSDTIAGITPTVCDLMDITRPALSTAGAFAPVIERIKAKCGLIRFDKCLIYAPDALGTLFIGKHPEIFAAVRARAPHAIELRSMFPPKTPVCFASMFTGALPEAHGIRKPERPVLGCDTLFDSLIRTGKKPAIAAVKDSSIDQIFRGREMDYFSEEYDPQVTTRALRLLKGDEHDFILAYHQEYDDSLHATTIESGRSLTAARNHAASFVELCAAAHDRWEQYNHLVIFTPDHGGHDEFVTNHGTHGEDITEDMLVTHFFAAQHGV
jgi:predicted AlkP superfamily pyrophosphatase or phosphodiesterase